MRKHVKPADAGASIPDPERGRDLPPEGAAVAWTAHWARLAMRGDVTVEELPPDPQPPEPEPEAGAP